MHEFDIVIIRMSLTSIRIVGRGGQGIKSAAHVIGTAAFLAGHRVQDQPVYGAERRGAPVTAFVRISDEDILERGHMSTPSLLAVVDDSLLADSTVELFADISDKTVIIVNTNKSAASISSAHGIRNQIVVSNLSALADEIIGRNAPVNSALVGMIGRILGQEFDDLRQSLELELRNIRIEGEELALNVSLARRAFDITEPVKLSEDNIHQKPKELACIDLEYHDPIVSTCNILSPGNTRTRRTGDWADFKPIINFDLCTKCMICFVYCPDSAITIEGESKYPMVDYGACKGCNICYTECPTKAISLERKRKDQ
jgi:pyruvate ferredoxin oxidoreductase gamma subunit